MVSECGEKETKYTVSNRPVGESTQRREDFHKDLKEVRALAK